MLLAALIIGVLCFVRGVSFLFLMEKFPPLKAMVLNGDPSSYFGKASIVTFGGAALGATIGLFLPLP